MSYNVHTIKNKREIGANDHNLSIFHFLGMVLFDEDKSPKCTSSLFQRSRPTASPQSGALRAAQLHGLSY
jgi:hypothetical protein